MSIHVATSAISMVWRYDVLGRKQDQSSSGQLEMTPNLIRAACFTEHSWLPMCSHTAGKALYYWRILRRKAAENARAIWGGCFMKLREDAIQTRAKKRWTCCCETHPAQCQNTSKLSKLCWQLNQQWVSVESPYLKTDVGSQMVPTNCILCCALGNISQTFPLQDVFGELVGVVLLMVPMDSGGHGGDLMIWWLGPPLPTLLEPQRRVTVRIDAGPQADAGEKGWYGGYPYANIPKVEDG